MSPPYEPMILVGNASYFPAPYSLPELSPNLRPGLAAIGTLALTSIVALVGLIAFVSYRLATWKSYHPSFPGGNQCVILILNLLLADLLQSMALSISFHWLRVGSILAPSAPCSLQAWLLHSGDISSGLFVLAIAAQTCLTTLVEKEISSVIFFVTVGLLWLFTFLLASLGVATHGSTYFVRAGPWCWVSEAYEGERLGTHYLCRCVVKDLAVQRLSSIADSQRHEGIFICQFGAVLIYAFLAMSLMRRVRQYRAAAQRGTFVESGRNQEILRVAKLMTLYPCVYVLLTLPLAAGRMWSMAHHGKHYSNGYAVFAGCMITSCGFVDVAMYSLTRRRLLVATGMETERPHSLQSVPGTKSSTEEPDKGGQLVNMSTEFYHGQC